VEVGCTVPGTLSSATICCMVTKVQSKGLTQGILVCMRWWGQSVQPQVHNYT
jgi:hypothetical protein